MRAYVNSSYPWRVFDELAGPSPYDWLNLAMRERNEPYPRVTVSENEQGLLLQAEVPGLGPEALSVTVEGNTLTLKGEKEQADGTKSPFERTFTLPDQLQSDRMAANLKYGLLKISIPKRDEVKPRQIAITAA